MADLRGHKYREAEEFIKRVKSKRQRVLVAFLYKQSGGSGGS